MGIINWLRDEVEDTRDWLVKNQNLKTDNFINIDDIHITMISKITHELKRAGINAEVDLTISEENEMFINIDSIVISIEDYYKILKIVESYIDKEKLSYDVNCYPECDIWVIAIEGFKWKNKN